MNRDINAPRSASGCTALHHFTAEMGVGLADLTLLIALTQGVFGQRWIMTLPPSIVAIDGSCITVPCRLNNPRNEKEYFDNCLEGGVWTKGSLGGAVIPTSPNPSSNTATGQRVGSLRRKNCTTVFHGFSKNHSDVYYFRLRCASNIFRRGVMIDIRAEPYRPSRRGFSLTSDSCSTEMPPPQLTSESPVSEGAQVRLQCSVLVPCSIQPPNITWLPRDDSRQEQTQMQQSVDGQTTMTSTLTFNAAANHHDQNVSCSVSYPLTAGGSSEPSAATQTLNILYAPRITVATVSTSVPVPEGHVVTFTCWSDANPPVGLYTWYRDDSGTLTKKGEGEKLVLKVSQKDNGVYLCDAQTQRGTQRSRPVYLEVIDTTGSIKCNVIFPYVMCGVLLLLYILTVVVDVCKYQSISRRLKQIELKGEHTYTNLNTVNINSDYDELKPKKTSIPDLPKYVKPPNHSQ